MFIMQAKDMLVALSLVFQSPLASVHACREYYVLVSFYRWPPSPPSPLLLSLRRRHSLRDGAQNSRVAVFSHGTSERPSLERAERGRLPRFASFLQAPRRDAT